MGIYRRIIDLLGVVLAVMIVLSGCHKDDSLNDIDNKSDAKLSLRLSLSNTALGLKSVSSEPNTPSNWTTWERAVDGRYIYNVTALLIQGKRLVAVKDIDLQGENKETTIEFGGNFIHGAYKLMVLANYKSHQAEDGANGLKTYNGVTELMQTVSTIVSIPGLDNFTDIYTDSFLNYKISSEDGVCKRVPQPLSLVKDIELHPGENIIEGELLRTYSRIRIVVDNHSNEQLFIKSLDFSNLFTQTEAYVFENIGYISNRRSINVAHNNAITPFTATSADPLKIDGKQSKVVFDAYILESRRYPSEGEYNYKFNLGYDGIENFVLESTTEVNNQNNLPTGYYLIYNPATQCYLVAGSNSVETKTMSVLTKGMTLSNEYVWSLVGAGSGTNTYYIATADELIEGATAYYMSNPSKDGVVLGDKKSVYFTLNKPGYWQNHLTLCSSGSGNNKYVSVDNSYRVVGTKNGNNQSNYFYLYSVQQPVSTTDVTVPLKTIDNKTGQPEVVDEIKRNDFINVVVTVSYNKNKGHFKFEVKDWGTGGGNVEFN